MHAKHSIVVSVDLEHIDELGHVNFLELQRLVFVAHRQIMRKFGVDINTLKEQDFCLMMLVVEKVEFHRELKLGDILDIKFVINRTRPMVLKFEVQVFSSDLLSASLSYEMVTAKFSTKRPIAVHKTPVKVLIEA